MSDGLRGFLHKALGIGADSRFAPTDEELAAELAAGGVLLLDIRSSEEYEQGHIPGALLVPPSQLDPESFGIEKDTPIVCYCASGTRSEYARGVLEQAGFTNVRNFGGIGRWTGAIEKGGD
ncbi:MAG: rhodanese-like domain-containing protein [Spirochaetales bacterium]